MPKNSGLNNYAQKALNEIDLSNVKKIEILKRRGEDIPFLVDFLYKEKRIITIGITGDDLYDEYLFSNPKSNLSLINTIDWIDEKARYGRPVLALIGKNKQETAINAILNAKLYKGNIGVPTKYINTSIRYLENLLCLDYETIKNRTILMNGSVDESIKLDMFEYCIDVVYSGDTLDRLNLKVIDIIRASDISTIMPGKYLMKNKRNI